MAGVMRPWQERDPRRLEREREAMLHRHPAMKYFAAPGVVGWKGAVCVNERPRPVLLLCPPDYPFRPPWVWEFDLVEMIVDSFTGHQFIDGSLCLYTADRGERAWRPDYTAADVLDRYREFRQSTEDGTMVLGENTSAPALLPEATLDSVHRTLVVPRPLWADLDQEGGHGQVLGRRTRDGSLAVLSRISPTRGAPAAAEIEDWSACDLTQELRGVYVHLGEEPRTWRALLSGPEAIGPLVARHAPGLRRGLARAEVVVLISRAGGAVALWRSRDGRLDPGTCSIVERYELREALYSRVDGVVRRPALSEVQVVLIGVGSMGSSVALHLAQSGIERFVLFDPDLLRPENIQRHRGDLRDLYRYKVDVVADLIRQRAPAAQVQTWRRSPLWDSSNEGAAAYAGWNAALACPRTLVVVTTADDRSEAPINAMLLAAQVPAVYGSVLGAAEYGRLFRVIPGETACYECIVRAQILDPDRHPRFAAARVVPRTDVAEYRQPGIPGLGVDVELVSALTARLALATIERCWAPGLGYDEPEGHHYLWANRAGWVLGSAMRCQRQTYERLPSCPACAQVSPAQTQP